MVAKAIPQDNPAGAGDYQTGDQLALENVDVSNGIPIAEVPVVVSLDLAATHAPIAKAPTPTIILIALCDRGWS